MGKVLHITEEDLSELLEIHSNKTVGKIMKRFELIADRDTLKKDVKELLHESYRDFRDLLIAYGLGNSVTQFKFTTKRGDTPAS